MVGPEVIENYMTQMGLSFDAVAPRTWVVRDGDSSPEGLVIALNGPVIVFQVKLDDISPRCDRLRLFEELLRLNAAEMVHGAYGLEGSRIVATDTLQAENLDFNEFQASVDSLNMSILTHYRRLQPLFAATA
jgi:hypothetical protein